MVIQDIHKNGGKKEKGRVPCLCRGHRLVLAQSSYPKVHSESRNTWRTCCFVLSISGSFLFFAFDLRPKLPLQLSGICQYL